MTQLLRGNALSIPLADDSVDLIVTSPPYFAQRSYRDGGEHYEGQIGSEPTPQDFLEALWSVTQECARVLKPGGSMFINLGDKYAGSGGHNNAGISTKSTLSGNGHKGGAGKAGPQKIKSTLRSAPDSYNKSTHFEFGNGVRVKSLMGIPWRFAIGCIDRCNLILRAEIVWSKRNGLPESVNDRVRRSHEQWFHLTKEGDYFTGIDEIREPHAAGTAERYAQGYGDRSNYDAQRSTSMSLGGDDWTANPLGKLPGSVWEISTEPLKVPEYFVNKKPFGTPCANDAQRRKIRRTLWEHCEQLLSIGQPCNVFTVDHFAAFPQEWPRRFILGWSPSGICAKCGEGRRPKVETDLGVKERDTPKYTPDANHGGESSTLGSRGPSAQITGYECACDVPMAPTRPAVILDPFVGTGTVPMVARALGRYGVGIDLSADYLRLANWRIFESGHSRKSRAKTDREAQGALL